ncbi:MAG: RES family NAD+ phosphorylase [Luteibaculaceae bacterium]
MLIYRICKAQYAKLRGSGFANRWNKDFEEVLYASQSISLATLELLVNRSGIRMQDSYCIMEIEVPANQVVFEIGVGQLPENWRGLAKYSYTQEIGSAWVRSCDSLLLKVPSAVIIQENNFIINTRHPDFSQIKIRAILPYFWDERLTAF